MIAIKNFRTIALGEFIPYEWLTDPIADFALDKNEKDENSSILKNMGIILLLVIFLAAVIAPIVICVRLSRACGKVHALFRAIKNKLVWNAVIRIML